MLVHAAAARLSHLFHLSERARKHCFIFAFSPFEHAAAITGHSAVCVTPVRWVKEWASAAASDPHTGFVNQFAGVNFVKISRTRREAAVIPSAWGTSTPETSTLTVFHVSAC